LVSGRREGGIASRVCRSVVSERGVGKTISPREKNTPPGNKRGGLNLTTGSE